MPTLYSHFLKFSFNFPFSFLHFSMTALQHCNQVCITELVSDVVR